MTESLRTLNLGIRRLAKSGIKLVIVVPQPITKYLKERNIKYVEVFLKPIELEKEAR